MSIQLSLQSEISLQNEQLNCIIFFLYQMKENRIIYLKCKSDKIILREKTKHEMDMIKYHYKSS